MDIRFLKVCVEILGVVVFVLAAPVITGAVFF